MISVHCYIFFDKLLGFKYIYLSISVSTLYSMGLAVIQQYNGNLTLMESFESSGFTKYTVKK